MRVSTSQMFNLGLNAILSNQAGVAKAQLQVATGKRILTPADDPAGAKKILDLNETLELARQYQTNASTATSRLALEDSVLDGVGNLLQRVRELAIQGNNSTLTNTDRQAIAAEVGERLGELVGLANTRDANDEHLFAGFSTRTRPFATVAPGNIIYNGDQGQRELQIGPSYRVADGNSGTQVFQAILNGNGTFSTSENAGNAGTGVVGAGSVVDPTAWVADTYTISFTSATDFEVRDSGAGLVASGVYTTGAAISFNGISVDFVGDPVTGDSFTVSPSVNQDAFRTVQNLVDALNTSGTGTVGQTQLHNAVNRFLTDVDQVFENVLEVRAGVGARLNAIDSEMELNADFEVQVQADLSAVENADLTELITRLNQQLGTLQAAQLSFAQLQNLSLFNYI